MFIRAGWGFSAKLVFKFYLAAAGLSDFMVTNSLVCLWVGTSGTLLSGCRAGYFNKVFNYEKKHPTVVLLDHSQQKDHQ